MSFSSRVKEELSRQIPPGRHCQLAEIAAIISLCGAIVYKTPEEAILRVQTENVAVARKYFTLIKKTFNINNEITIRKNAYLKKNRTYVLQIKDMDKVLKILLATKQIESKGQEIKQVLPVDSLITHRSCCKRAYIRGAFLASGSLSDPEKTYHLEVVCPNMDVARYLQEMINSFEMDAKIVTRKKYYVVYLKEGAQIVDLLNVMEAHLLLMDLENVRILKEMRNTVNRIVNCETANIHKTVSASVKQLEDIRYIESTIGIHALQEGLYEVAQVRLTYPSASLKELGTLLSPPVGKSGVNHRLRKLSIIAQNIRDNKEAHYD